MIGFWNEEEDAALQGLSLEAQIIYLRGIRRFADRNGTAGIERRINRASLSEVCHFLPSRRSPRQESKPTWEQVRCRLAELENAGLIVQKQNLVFDLPLSVQMKTTRRPHVDHTPLTTPMTTPCEELQGNGFNGVDHTVDGLKTTRGNTGVDHTTSPVTITILKKEKDVREEAGEPAYMRTDTRAAFTMHVGWTPKQPEWTETLKFAGHKVKPEQFTEYALNEFILNNINNTMPRLEGQWQTIYVNFVAQGRGEPPTTKNKTAFGGGSRQDVSDGPGWQVTQPIAPEPKKIPRTPEEMERLRALREKAGVI